MSVRVFELLGRFTPTKAKRVMFVFSVLGYLDEGVKDDRELISQLNNLLSFPKSPDFCQQSANAECMIWKGADMSFEFMDMTRPWPQRKQALINEQEQMVDFFIDKCPPWLRYGQARDMRRDLQRLFRFVSHRRY